MKNMKISLKMKEDIMSNQFLMLRFQKDSLDAVGFRTYGGGARVLNPKVTFWVLNVPLENLMFVDISLDFKTCFTMEKSKSLNSKSNIGTTKTNSISFDREDQKGWGSPHVIHF